MSKLECADYNDQLSQLLPLLEADGSYWVGMAQSLDWLLVDHKNEDLKIKVRNPIEKLFVKVYSTKTEGYARAVFEALSELSKLELKTPILPAQVECDGALIFTLGQVVGDSKYGKIYSEAEQLVINQVLAKYGLKHLEPEMKIGLVSIDGKNFSVDPFQDDMSSIFEFVHKK